MGRLCAWVCLLVFAACYILAANQILSFLNTGNIVERDFSTLEFSIKDAAMKSQRLASNDTEGAHQPGGAARLTIRNLKSADVGVSSRLNPRRAEAGRFPSLVEESDKSELQQAIELLRSTRLETSNSTKISYGSSRDDIIQAFASLRDRRDDNNAIRNQLRERFNNRRRDRDDVRVAVVPGYKPRGGSAPPDDLQLYPDPATWPSIDNGTCLGPSDEPYFEWQKRAPYAIVLGTMKGGTHAVVSYLWQHPLVATHRNEKVKEMKFFSSRDFRRSELGIPREENQKIYASLFLMGYSGISKPHPPMYAIDKTPRYMLWSDRIPDAIMCVSPWAKLIAVLRNPIERAISHFKYEDQARRARRIPMVDWEEWIRDDLRLLKEAGVVQDWNKVDFDTFAGSEDEMLAWKTYLRNPNSKALLGRGLYAIQLEHYFAAMDRAGKPRSDLMVIQSEDLVSNTQSVYDKILQFLELPTHQLTDAGEKHKTKDVALRLPDHLRKTLEEFFEPYNHRLYKLLGWRSVWDTVRTVQVSA